MATSRTSPTALKPPMMTGAPRKKPVPIRPRNARLYPAAIHTARSARAGSFAPSACPTMVAAALESPHAGMMAKRITRMPIV